MAQWKGGINTKMAQSPAPPSPAPPPPLTRRAAGAVRSITREEIDEFWRRRKMIEEDHLLAAQKAAARLRAKALKEEDYRRFEELVRRIMEDGDECGNKRKEGEAGDKKKKIVEEVGKGIKDWQWWTRSSYAYLNQPAIRSMGESSLRLTGTYVPQRICASFCSPSPCRFRTTYFSVF